LSWLVVVALAAPLAIWLAWDFWKRPEKRFTLYSSAGRWAEALPYARILARRPANAETRGRRQMNLGTILARVEQWDEARAALEEALVTQDASKDSYASLTRHTLALLELRRGEVARARSLAAEIEKGPEDLRGRAKMLFALALLVEEKPAEAKALIEPQRAELVGSKKPSDMMLLAVLAAADETTRAELAAVIKERMALAQRKELAAQAPLLARVL
jgi:hypothetical protein